MNRKSSCLILLGAFLIISCAKRNEEFADTIEILENLDVDISSLEALYVYDEYSCSVCSENVFGNIATHRSSDEYIVLYAAKQPELFRYEVSPLVGYVSEASVHPVGSELIRLLRIKTNTVKGNYKLVIANKTIRSIENF